MGFWSRTGLLALGAAAGYLGSRRGQVPADLRRIRSVSQELTHRATEQNPAARPREEADGGIMDRIWTSSAVQPLKSGMLTAMRFAATVKAGMVEKEDELNRRYTDQQQSLRPGSLDGWQREADASGIQTSGAVQASSRRLPRDADLPPGFLTSDPASER